MPFSEEEFKHIGDVAMDLLDLRHHLRMLVAVSNADPAKWFGGSPSLQAAAQRGLGVETVMNLRRHHDFGRRDERRLVSVRRLLHELGRPDAARAISDDEALCRVERFATLRMAHGITSAPVPATTFRDVFEACHAVCRVFRAHAYNEAFGTRDDALDRVPAPQDAWGRAVRRTGVPVLDFPLSEIFLDPMDQAPSLRGPSRAEPPERES